MKMTLPKQTHILREVQEKAQEQARQQRDGADAYGPGEKQGDASERHCGVHAQANVGACNTWPWTRGAR